ncbi:type I pullulanase [Facklamia hominis]|uniref:Type I pullulanase n=1 Tax=Facklamia hominis TaxID=178214 RepID=A0AAJ1V221_9LACT|nr:type I pullulanase [Facklamia hominis]MDK7187100.1 type I pullulanase [Facklamia hominis]
MAYRDHLDLGVDYQVDQTRFSLWAPKAKAGQLIVYAKDSDQVADRISMTKDRDSGVFSLTLKGDCHGYIYRYALYNGRDWISTMDPYAKAATVNGQRAVVVDFSRTNPDHWGEEEPLPALASHEILIYELSVRDFTQDPASGVKNGGYYLGLAQSGGRSPQGMATGLDYLAELGISHVQLMPVFDFQTIDESQRPRKSYNWGYDPQNYNLPEGSLASDPFDPICRIRELKALIQALHQKGLRVIMDVVYNHVYRWEDHPFHLTAPGYFFRYDLSGQLANGSWVGNETASEREKMRQYMIDSLSFWVEEYHIDGFRFDLMGLHDLVTMRLIRQELTKIKPDIFLLGEGWKMSQVLPPAYAATLENAGQLPGYAFFNDQFRKVVRGQDEDLKHKSFINGGAELSKAMGQKLLGQLEGISLASPLQLIQYSEVHDSYTLFDRLKEADPSASLEQIKRQQALALALGVLGQGIPFIHAGQEFMRSKTGYRDSYNLPDAINQVDWQLADCHQDLIQYVKDLIRLRKAFPLLGQAIFDQIERTAQLLLAQDGLVGIEYQAEDTRIMLFFNGTSQDKAYRLISGSYRVLLQGMSLAYSSEAPWQDLDQIQLPAYSATVIQGCFKG